MKRSVAEIYVVFYKDARTLNALKGPKAVFDTYDDAERYVNHKFVRSNATEVVPERMHVPSGFIEYHTFYFHRRKIEQYIIKPANAFDYRFELEMTRRGAGMKLW